MEYIIHLAGFFGAWLVEAGSLYQAALELRDEDIQFDHLKAARDAGGEAPSVSVWWWLLPPVKLYLEQRRSRANQRTYFEKLSQEDTSAFVSFMSKANGWTIVAGGGLLLACEETYELVTIWHLSLWVFWILVVAGIALSIANVIMRVKRNSEILRSKGVLPKNDLRS